MKIQKKRRRRTKPVHVQCQIREMRILINWVKLVGNTHRTDPDSAVKTHKCGNIRKARILVKWVKLKDNILCEDLSMA